VTITQFGHAVHYLFESLYMFATLAIITIDVTTARPHLYPYEHALARNYFHNSGYCFVAGRCGRHEYHKHAGRGRQPIQQSTPPTRVTLLQPQRWMAIDYYLQSQLQVSRVRSQKSLLP
jgi:hypothetical protein